EVTRMDRARVPILTPLGQRTPGMSDLVFCMGLSPASQGTVLARFVAEKWKPDRTTVLVDQRQTDAALIGDTFVREMLRERGKIEPREGKVRGHVMERRFGKDVDLKEEAKRVDQDKPQVLVYAGAPRDFATLRDALKSTPALVFAGEEGSARPLRDAGMIQGI